MDKSASTSDWRARPLSESQIQYAAADVAWMHKLRGKLKADLVMVGRQSWFKEEMVNLLAGPSIDSTDDLTAWLRVRRASKANVSADGRAALKELAGWRAKMARTINLAETLLLSDDALVQIATVRPRTRAELREIRTVRGSTARHHWRAILQCIHGINVKNVDDWDEDMNANDSGAEDVQVPLEKNKNGVRKQILFHTLWAAVYRQSLEMNISQYLLATKTDVTELITTEPGTDSDIRLLRGWRAAAVGNMLFELKQATTAGILQEK